MAEVRVKISGNVSPLVNAFNRAQGAVRYLGNSIKNVLGSSLSQIGMGLSAAGFVAYGRAVMETAAKIKDGSLKLQVSTRDYQRFDWMAERTGATIDEVRASFGKMSDVIADAGRRSPQAIGVLDRLGVTLAELGGKGAADQFVLLARAINDLPDGEEKLSLIRDIFGRGTLNLGAMIAQIDELTGEFDSMNLAMGDDAVNAADRASDAIEDLKRAMASMAADTGFLRYIADVAEALRDLANATPEKRRSTMADIGMEMAAGMRYIPGLHMLGAVGAKLAKDAKDQADLERANREAETPEAKAQRKSDVKAQADKNRQDKQDREARDARRKQAADDAARRATEEAIRELQGKGTGTMPTEAPPTVRDGEGPADMPQPAPVAAPPAPPQPQSDAVRRAIAKAEARAAVGGGVLSDEQRAQITAAARAKADADAAEIARESVRRAEGKPETADEAAARELEMARELATRKGTVLSQEQEAQIAAAASAKWERDRKDSLDEYLGKLAQRVKLETLAANGMERQAAIQEEIDRLEELSLREGRQVTDAQRRRVVEMAGQAYDMEQAQRKNPRGMLTVREPDITDAMRRIGAGSGGVNANAPAMDIARRQLGKLDAIDKGITELNRKAGIDSAPVWP